MKRSYLVPIISINPNLSTSPNSIQKGCVPLLRRFLSLPFVSFVAETALLCGRIGVARSAAALSYFLILTLFPLLIWLHAFIMDAVKVDFVCFQVQIAPVSFAAGIALTLLVTIVVDKLLGKKIDRINMAESLKSVE